MKILTTRNISDIELLIAHCSSRIYKKAAPLSFNCFFTKERLSIEEAMKKTAHAVENKTKWGTKWEYGWFFTSVTIPECLEGKRIVFKADLAECVVFVNGEVYGALDKDHFEITLTRSAKAGELFEIALEAYAGHGPLYTQKTILPGEVYAEFSEDITQRETTDGEFGTFCDEIFSFCMDMKVLYNLASSIEEDSMRYKMICKGLKKVCTIVDAESEDSEFFEQLKEARKILAPLLQCKNGSSAPMAYSVGHSHLDLEWLWPKDETQRKVARTIGNQLRLIDEYPDYKYVQSQPWILETAKNDYPELYERIKKAVKDKNFIPEGGTWVEMDTNMPSGESLVRQFIFGKSFIKKEFDRDSKILWLPDVFGCSAALPQIMKGCGADYIYNAKMAWSYANNIPLYKGTFMWRGVDGTDVLINNNESYAAPMTPESNITSWKSAENTENVPDILITFGHGDGGGGATKEQVESALRQMDLEGAPKVKMSDPVDFYRDVEANYDIDKVFEGEFWFAEHKGVYTTQANTKRYNRKCEISLHEAEFWSSLLGKNDTKQKLDAMWKELLFNQFHDIIPGTAIAKTYERAEKSYKDILEKASAVTDGVLGDNLTENKDAITVFNSLPWDRWEEIELPDGISYVENSDNEKFYTYKSGEKTYASVFSSACSMESFALYKGETAPEQVGDNSLVLENEFLRAEFNQFGELISLRDKSNQEYIKTPSNKLKIYKNNPHSFDAWDIEIDYKEKEVKDCCISTAKITSKTKDKTVLHISTKLLNSTVEQDVILKRNSKRLDFLTTINWQETHKLLKVDFDTNILANDLVSEIQFGHIKRATHNNFDQDTAMYEKFQHKWSALMETGRSFALLNDCKYGISADSGKMSLTLLTSAMAPTVDTDKGVHNFTYSVCVSDESLEKSHIIQEAYALNYPVLVKSGYTEKQKFFTVSDKNVVIETVKAAEDGSGDIIVRLYESSKRTTDFTLSCGFLVKDVEIVNMLESSVSKVLVENSDIKLSIKAFEVLTLRIKK